LFSLLFSDERSKALKEANEKCSQLQDTLDAKDAEVSLNFRRKLTIAIYLLEIRNVSLTFFLSSFNNVNIV